MDHDHHAQAPQPEIDASPLEGGVAPEILRAVDLMLGMLETEPDLGATLLPGYVITPRPMTSAERAARYLPRANERRRKNNQERLRKLKDEIALQLAADPGVSDFNLAIALNKADLHTYTGLAFNATRVEELRRRLKRMTAEAEADRH